MDAKLLVRAVAILHKLILMLLFMSHKSLSYSKKRYFSINYKSWHGNCIRYICKQKKTNLS